jgi:hypothetical protein
MRVLYAGGVLGVLQMLGEESYKKRLPLSAISEERTRAPVPGEVLPCRIGHPPGRRRVHSDTCFCEAGPL